ncbi:MAG: hypothetical protein IPN32_39085 [Deltaproteobacteria bacterium]|nr:hypothetical protein [Deltaproteobacteria bacterium]
MRKALILAVLVACKQPAEPPPQATDAEIAEAQNAAVRVHKLAEHYQLQKRKCPSLADLIRAGMMKSPEVDRWGSELSIVCSSDWPSEVVSPGPDKTIGTDDDISSVHQAPTTPRK